MQELRLQSVTTLILFKDLFAIKVQMGHLRRCLTSLTVVRIWTIQIGLATRRKYPFLVRVNWQTRKLVIQMTWGKITHGQKPMLLLVRLTLLANSLIRLGESFRLINVSRRSRNRGIK